MTRTRRSADSLTAVAADAAVAALRAAGFDAAIDGRRSIVLRLDGLGQRLGVEPVAYCTGQRARELIGQCGCPRLVVADRITAEARDLLTDAGWSWLDRRGRLHVRAPGVRVDVDVPPEEASAPTDTGPAVAGRGGLSVGYWLCEHPGDALSPTKSAPRLGLAPSTISTAVRRLADAGLVNADGRGIFPELFWELAAAWRPARAWLLAVPEASAHRSPDPLASGWRRTGTAAAVAYGAPVATAGGEPFELYVTGPVDISIALRRYGAAQPGLGPAVVAVPPVSDVVSGDPNLPMVDGWQAAPKLAVALDLAQDRARGREILQGWDTPGAVWR